MIGLVLHLQVLFIGMLLHNNKDTLLQTARRPMSLDPAYEGMCSATEAAELGGAGE